MTKVKKHVVKVASGIMAGMMAVGGVFTGLPMFASADSGSYYEKVEFETANRFSSDSGNRVENNQFSGYSGSGYVYLASGWADVTFPITEAGKYNITITSTSDQYKENWLYLDDSSAGTLKTEAGSWNSYTYTCDLTEGTHKFGVSTSWGYVALDNVKVEKVGSSVDVEEETTTTTPDIPVDVVISEDNMYVQGTKLYDANGNEFIMRGVNIPHAWYTDKTETSINAVADLGANCVRVVLADGYQWDKTSREEVENIINICKQNKLICILEVHDYTGKNDPALLQQAVNY